MQRYYLYDLEFIDQFSCEGSELISYLIRTFKFDYFLSEPDEFSSLNIES